jgi:hypothetical protein
VASKKPHEKRKLLSEMFWDGKRLPIVLRHHFKPKVMVKNLLVVVFKFLCLERFLMRFFLVGTYFRSPFTLTPERK